MKIVRFLGGLGNQMFQYAFYLSLSNKHKNVKADVSGFEDYTLHNGLEIEYIFNIKLNRASTLAIRIFDPIYRDWIYRKLRRILNLKKAFFVEKEDFIFDSDALNSSKSRLYWGYWQNTNYFEYISDKIRSSFVFKTPLNGKNSEIYNRMLQCESISLHVRRGDYLGHETLGGICDLDYYEKAISVIQEQVLNPVFFIFSNDIDWCRKNLNIKNAKYVSWNKDENSYIDMQLMSVCKHNIIANSSFSWWAAWLNVNQKKIVVSPKKWANNSHKTLALEEWIKC